MIADLATALRLYRMTRRTGRARAQSARWAIDLAFTRNPT